MKTKGSNEIWGQVSLNKTNDQLHNLLACHHELLLFKTDLTKPSQLMAYVLNKRD